MKVYEKWVYKSWLEEPDDDVRAIALCKMDDSRSGWFDIAINCMRDGDMGEKDEMGVYQRHWLTDSISASTVYDFRNALPDEVRLYMDYVGSGANGSSGEVAVEVVLGGDECYALIEYEPLPYGAECDMQEGY